MTEQEFKSRHPDLTLRYGKSSEDSKWWVDARGSYGRRIIAFKGRSTLAEALSDLDALWRRTPVPHISPESLGLKKKPMLPEEFPRQLINYGLVETLADEPEEDN